MKKIFTTAVCICLATTFLTSCVAKRKYVAARNRANQEEADNMALKQRLARERELSLLREGVRQRLRPTP